MKYVLKRSHTVFVYSSMLTGPMSFKSGDLLSSTHVILAECPAVQTVLATGLVVHMLASAVVASSAQASRDMPSILSNQKEKDQP